MKLAIAAWALPMFALLYLAAAHVLDSAVPWPEPVCAPDAEYGDCTVPESKLRDFASVASAEKVTVPIVMLGIAGGIGLGVAALIQARGKPELKRARKVAIGALVVLFVVPALFGGFLLFIASVSHITG